MTVKVLVALEGGVPLSVTTVVIKFVLGVCCAVGVQAITPSVPIIAPVGGLTSE